MTHLQIDGDYPWCGEENAIDVTDNPRDATCPACLCRAAEYGAAAAMRYAAVEAGATQDPELVRERDNALHKVNAINNALERQKAFFCEDCMKLYNVAQRALSVNGVSWCEQCAPHDGKVPT